MASYGGYDQENNAKPYRNCSILNPATNSTGGTDTATSPVLRQAQYYDKGHLNLPTWIGYPRSASPTSLR